MQLCEFAFGPGRSFKRNIFNSPEYEAEFLKLHPVDSYRTIQTYTDGKPADTPLNDLKQTVGIYFDIDCPDTLKTEKAFKKTCHKAIRVANWLGKKLHAHPAWFHYYFSGSKGFHIIVPTFVMGDSFRDIPNLHLTMKHIAQMVATDLTKHKFPLSEAFTATGIDPNVYDHRRLFRLPNSINSKSGLYKIRMDYKEIKEITLKDLKTLASNPRDEEDWLDEIDWRLYEKNNVRPYAEKLFEEANALATHAAEDSSNRTKLTTVYSDEEATLSSSNLYLRTEALKHLSARDDKYFRDKLTESAPSHLTFKNACDWLSQNADLHFLTGLGSSFLCIYHDDHHPSAGILPPSDDHNYWGYRCFGSKDGNCLQRIKSNINLVADVIGATSSDAVKFLCKIYNIQLVAVNGNANNKPLNDFISDNKKTFIKLSKLKSGKCLADLSTVYRKLLSTVSKISKMNGVEAYADDVYAPMSCRYLAQKLKVSECTICRKLNLLAALGFIKKVNDFDLPTKIVMRDAKFTKKCEEEYDGRTIQYYQVIDLLQTFTDGRIGIEDVVKTQLKVWYASGYGIRNVCHDTIEAVFGVYVAAMVYVKPAAMEAVGRRRRKRLASLPI